MVLVTLCFVPAQATDVNTVKAKIAKHAIEMGVDPAMALSIARTESGFNHKARSNHGAVGVFQLMPSTARRMGLNPYSLTDNIKGGIKYYKAMYKMFGSVELALAAYNAGPGNVKRYNNSIPPYAETKRFVSKIMKDYKNYKVNPDPAIKAAKVAASKPQPAASTTKANEAKAAEVNTTQAKVTPVTEAKVVAVQVKTQPAPELIHAKEVKAAQKVEVVNETPVELELEATSLAI
jgi:hypothetical protein